LVHFLFISRLTGAHIASMPRQIRIQYAGAIYHLLSRGDRREDIFLDDVDRHEFLATLAAVCQKTGWRVHAYCLMRNHFHLVVETPEPNLVEGMSWLLSTYTIRLNRRHRLTGHAFGGRYKALLVDHFGNNYFRTVCDYVHLNPVRAGVLKNDDNLSAYPWSSLSLYAAAREHRPAWICVDRLLGAHGIPQDTPTARAEFQLRMEARRAEDQDEQTLQAIRQSWSFGKEEFKLELLQRLEIELGEHHSGDLLQQSSAARAERIINEKLTRLGWTESDLAGQRKSAPEKLAIAARLRKETTLTIKQISARVHLGTSKGANANLHRFMQPSRIGPHRNRPTRTPVGR
jgi:putative transposase